MKQTYSIKGLTCGSCVAKVESTLESIDQIIRAQVDKQASTVTVSYSEHVTLSQLQAILPAKYTLATDIHNTKVSDTDDRSWFETYKPIVLIFSYILGTSVLIQVISNDFNIMQLMQHFMAGFFLVFSFFKLLNVQGFVQSYAMYDLVAKKYPAWGYIYVFVELGLGIAYLTNINPILTNAVTFVVMSVSIIGVLQTVLNKQKIQCACLGSVFNLPMSTVTIIQDGLMIVMSAAMLFHYI